MSKCHRWHIEVRVTRVATNVRSWKYELVRWRKPKSTYKGLWKVGSSKVLLVSIKGGRETSRGSSESKQQAVLRAACCVFGARRNIVRDVVFDALLSHPCAWLHPTDPIRDQKTNAFDTSMASPSRQQNFTVVSHRYIITAAECRCSCIDRVWALPPCSTLGWILSLSEFGRSRHRVWALPPSLGALRWWWPVFKCTCVLGCQYYQTLWVLCSASGSDTRAWFSRNRFRHSWGRVLRQAGCCDTSQHRWQSLNEDWVFIVDSWPHAAWGHESTINARAWGHESIINASQAFQGRK